MQCEVQRGKDEVGLLVGVVGCRIDGKIQQSSFAPVVNVIITPLSTLFHQTVHL